MTDNTVATFTRETSGLVREFRTIDVFVFNVIAFSLGLVLAVTPSFLGTINPHAHVLLVLTFGVILTFFNGLTYGLFGAIMPRSGGDYVFIGRSLRPSLGFAANWGLTWSQFLGMGVYTVWCVETALAPGLDNYGSLSEASSLSSLAQTIMKPIPKALLGTLIIASVFLVLSRGIRVFRIFLDIFFLIALLGSLATAWLLWTTTPEEFVVRFNEGVAGLGGGNDAYSRIIELAAAAGHDVTESWSVWESFKALPLGYWVFIGFTFSVYVGNEVRRPERSQIFGILGALVFGYLFYMVTLGRYYEVVGRSFNNSIAQVAGAENSPVAYNSMPFLVGFLTDSKLISFLVSFSTFLWFYLLLFIMAQVCVRNLFAWSMDRLMPKWLANVSARTANPTMATLVVAVAVEIFLLVHIFAGIAFINYIALFSVCFLVAGVAAVLFPSRRPKDFAIAHPVARIKVGKVPLIVIAGCGNIILFVWVLIMALTNPGVGGVEGKLPLAILLLVYGSGLVIYYYVRHAQKRASGIDLDVLLEELPPG